MHKKKVKKLEVINNILDLLKKSGKNQTDLMSFLGVNRNIFTDWKAGRNKSYPKYLPQIAEFFGVSVDYLLGNTLEKEKAAEPGGLSAADARPPQESQTNTSTIRFVDGFFAFDFRLF